MSNEKILKLALVSVMVILLLSVTSTVFATNTASSIVLPNSTNTTIQTGNSIGNTTNTITENSTSNSISTITANKVSSPNVTNNTNTNKNSTVYKNSTNLPSTGLDYSIVFIIIACAISAIYAYKKISDYNVK